MKFKPGIQARTLAMLDRTPWAMAESSVRALHAAIRAPIVNLSSCGMMDDEDDDDDIPPVMSLAGDVAIISIRGPIFCYASWWDRYFGTTSYEAIGNAVDYAVGSDKVKSILYVADSPGGQAVGCGELAAVIRAAALRKPSMGFIAGQASSACYYLISATREIVIAPSAIAGSIGTMVLLIDDTGMMEQLGLKEIPVVSANAPDKYPDITKPEGVALWQESVDTLAGLFVADVAKYRGTTIATVKNDFGQGWIKIGADAVSAGLADRVGTLDGVLSQLASGYRPRAKGSGSPASSSSPTPLKASLERSRANGRFEIVLPR